MKTKRGFTLIEVLIVVVVIGLIVAIAIPALLSALDKGRQKRAMSDLRNLGTAVESYRVDHRQLPAAGSGTVGQVLAKMLEPTYIKVAPAVDGWRAPYQVMLGPDDYSLISYGRGSAADPAVSLGPTTDFTNDIYFSNGTFTVWPEGMQR